MRKRAFLAIVLAAVAACAAASFSRHRLLTAVVFALTVGLVALTIPENNRSMRLVMGRVVSGAAAGGWLLTALTHRHPLDTCLAVAAGVAILVTPIAAVITQVQNWAATARENSVLSGFRRAALATAFLAAVALYPWEMLLRGYTLRPMKMAFILVMTVAAPALAIALHTAIMAKSLPAIDGLFEHAAPPSFQDLPSPAVAIDLGMGAMAKVSVGAAHLYRQQAPEAICCRGDSAQAGAALRRLSGSAAAVAFIALLHAAALFFG